MIHRHRVADLTGIALWRGAVHPTGALPLRILVRPMLLGIWLTASCYAYRPVAQAPAPDSRVRIVFLTAIPVTTIGLAGDTARRTYEGVLEANGVIQAAAADTISLRLGELRTATGALTGVADRIAILPAAQVARIEEKRFQAGTTLLAGVGVSALALATYVVLLTAAITKAF